MPPLAITADHHDNGQTLAAVLKNRFKLSWSKAKQTIERRHVRVAGQIVADGAYRVRTGKRITIAVGAIEAKAEGGRWKTEGEKGKAEAGRRKVEEGSTPPSALRLPPLPAPEILFSDDEVVVVYKPAGMTTNRNAEEAAEFGKGQRFLPGTLADRVPVLLSEPKSTVIAVHRIDQGTSGLVVFARNKIAAQHLTRQFKAHSVERKYLALVRGTPVAQRIESQLVDDRGDGRRGSAAEGKKAVTHLKVIEQFDGFALVECQLETGRTHQVRIHLGEAGTPLCGETVYDRPKHGKPLPDGSGAERPMLHAAVLGFEHPKTGEILRFEAEPPADFALVQNACRG